MKGIRFELITTCTATVLLSLLMFFWANYFVIEKNAGYMFKTQNQINDEIFSVIRNSPGNMLEPEIIDKVKQKAGFYNVGISIIDGDGVKSEWQPNKNARILKWEVGGHIVTKQVVINEKGLIKLTYFQPWFAEDDTVKFFPVFWRLAGVFFILTLILSGGVVWVASASIRDDIKKATSMASNLVKGSSMNSSKPAIYSEVGKLIEELTALREIVLKKEQLNKRMTADLAHELRTPLTTLQSHLEALIDEVWQPTRERFLSCHEEILRLIRLVGDLENLSKIEDKKIILDKTGFDITALVKSIARNFEGELKHKNITLKINGQIQQLRADKDKASQVIVNLLSNSLKYTPVNGRILLDITGDKSHVYVVINDNGIGIPPKDISSVFNRLYRSDSSRTRATGGAGIGLTIARTIIEAHRGSIDVISQEGLGTEITVIFPRR